MSIKNILMTTILLSLLLPMAASAQQNLLIIAPDEFIDELQPLKSFKVASVRPTILLPLSQIYNDPQYNGSRDDPEKIKRCIASYEARGLADLVMLVGDCDKFPVRYCLAYNTEWGDKYYPSDLYYADLYDKSGSFDNWDGDGDNIIGEMDFSGGKNINLVNLDNIDMYPDVGLSRVPASDGTEVTTFVNKIIKYELTAPGNWYGNAYLVVGDWGGESKMDAISSYLTDFTVYKRYWSQAPWKNPNDDDSKRADEMNRFINLGAGLIFFHGHGGQTEWGKWYRKSNLSGLTNTDRFPVIFAFACYTGRFHFNREYYLNVKNKVWDRREKPTPPTPYPEPMALQRSTYDTESLAEHFLVKRNTGAIAYIGAASVAEHGGWELCPYFAHQYDQGERVLGTLWKNAMTDFVDKVEKEAMNWYAFIHIHKMMFFGDPSLRMGCAFTTTRSGDVSDTWFNNTWEPLFPSYSCSRIVGNITVKTGAPLTIVFGASILFERGTKISAPDTNLLYGFRIDGSSDAPVYLLNFTPSYKHSIGVKVNGQIRSHNGGEIKLY